MRAPKCSTLMQYSRVLITLSLCCVCITVHGLPLGAPHGRMGPVHSTLCNNKNKTVTQKHRLTTPSALFAF